MAALGGGYETRPEEKKRLIVNEQGEFVRPADLQKTMGGPLFSPYEEEEQEFLFDDDLDWRASVQSLPVRRRAGGTAKPPPGTGQKETGEGQRPRAGQRNEAVEEFPVCVHHCPVLFRHVRAGRDDDAPNGGIFLEGLWKLRLYQRRAAAL